MSVKRRIAAMDGLFLTILAIVCTSFVSLNRKVGPVSAMHAQTRGALSRCSPEKARMERDEIRALSAGSHAVD